VAVLSLALGIGANAAVFSLANALLLRPLPVRDPARLVALFTVTPDFPAHLPVSWPNFRDFRERSRALTGLIATGPATVSLSGNGEPEQLYGQMVTGDYFDVLGVKPALGRAFLPEEDRAPGGPPVAVLGDGLWRRRFGADPKIVGRTIRLNGQPFTVVGVAPPGFRGLQPLDSPELWVPMAMYPRVLPGRLRPLFESRAVPLLRVVGRLAPGASREQAEQEVKAIAAALAAEHPANQRRTVVLLPLLDTVGGPDDHAGYVRAAGLLLALVGAVLLIACANLASLLLARAAGRRPEMAVRLSLGSSRGRLVRQLLAESLLLALAGGLAGLLLAAWARRLMPLLGSPYLPDTLEVPLDARVVAFTLALSALTGLLFGLAPALQAGRSDLSAGFGGRSGHEPAPGRLGRLGLQGLLVAIQIALATVALTGAAVFLRSLTQMRAIDPGFEPEHLLVLSLDLDGAGYDENRGKDLLDRVVERLAAVPGVRSAAVGENLLLVEQGLRRPVALEGRAADTGAPVLVQTNAVGPGYFETLGIRRLRGRGFLAGDRAGAAPVAVINQTLADLLWKGEDPLGRHFRFLGRDEPEREVVGVVRDSSYNDLGEEPQPYVFLPWLQAYSSAVTLHVRTRGSPGDLAGTVRREVQALIPEVPLVDMRPMSRVLDQELWAPRTGAAFFSVLAALALLLSLLGVYGVTAYGISRRRQEIGIRTALGARPADVSRLFVMRSLAAVAAGLALGLAGVLALARLIAGMLYGVAPTEPSLVLAAALLLSGAALLAAWIPARRAARVSPAQILKQE
jgi:predicted permease